MKPDLNDSCEWVILAEDETGFILGFEPQAGHSLAMVKPKL